MASDPYQILGVSKTASEDEVKKAYRKKARENHPDLNPNDPSAAKRMKDINEAYDRIINPDKYARETVSAGTRNPYGGYSSGGGYSGSGGYGGSGYGTGGYGNYGDRGPGYGRSTQGGYGTGGTGSSQPGGSRSSGPYGWSGGFDFDDLFGFGFASEAGGKINPEVSAHDSAEIRAAISYINAGQPAQAVTILRAIPSTGRDARWHYISAIANHDAGNSLAALEHIRKAVRMDPNNADYARAQRVMQQTGQTYQTTSQERGFSMNTMSPGLICCGLVMGQYFCRMFAFGMPC